MVRKYVKKRAERTYTAQDVIAAVNDVKNRRRSYRSAAAHYGIPKTVIANRIVGRKTPVDVLGAGRSPALGLELENQLTDLIVARADFGYPMDKNELFDFVKEFCDYRNIETPFRSGRPGQDWYLNFMKRHPRLSLKKAQSLQNKRAEASDPFVVEDHFKNLQTVVEENNVNQYPELFFNCDESGFCTDPSKIKSIGLKNKALYQRIRGTGRENITINVCVSADGAALPPHIIFQGCAVLPRWTGEGEDFPGTVYAATGKGYMEEPVFYSWFADKFVPHVNDLRKNLPEERKDQKALLMFDGHRSHISARLVQKALENNIILFRLPSHLTHRLQPLDYGVFGPLKKSWDRILLKEMRKTLGATNKNKMSRKEFSLAVKELWTHHLTPDIIVSGFYGTGSLPVDRTKFPQTDFDQAALARFRKYIQQETVKNQNQSKTAEGPTQQQTGMNQSTTTGGAQPCGSEPGRDDLPDAEESRPQQQSATEPVPSMSKVPLKIQATPEKSVESAGSSEDVQGQCSTTLCASGSKPNIPTQGNIEPKRSAIDYFMITLKDNMQNCNAPPASKEKQIRLKQLQYGEVLTSQQVLDRLHQEEERRQKNKSTKRKKQEVKQNKETTKSTKTNKSTNSQPNKKKAKTIDILECSESETSEDNELEMEMQTAMENNSDDDMNLSSEETENLVEQKDEEKESKKTCSDGETIVENEQEKSDIPIAENDFDVPTDENLVDSYMAISSMKTWYVGYILEKSPTGYVTMKFLERIGSIFRWPRKDKIEQVSPESFLTPVFLKGENKFKLHPPVDVVEKLWKAAKH